MNGALFRHTLRERLSQPYRVAALAGLFLAPLALAFVEPEPSFGDGFPPVLLTLVLGAGLVGLDVSSGVLALVLTRPVSRFSYAVSKWAAVSVLAAAASTLQLVCLHQVVRFRFGFVSLEDLAAGVVERTLLAFGAAAVLLLLSSLGAGIADLAAWLGLRALAGSLTGAGVLLSSPAVSRAGREMAAFLAPTLDVYAVAGGDGAFTSAVAYTSTVTLAIGLAVVFLNRKALSYAAA